MANRTLYLRPTEDINVSHRQIPADSPCAAVLINETEDDDFSTCIYLESNDDRAYSEFKVGIDNGLLPQKVIKASFKLSVEFRYGRGSHDIQLVDENDNVIYYLSASGSNSSSGSSSVYISYSGGSFNHSGPYYCGSIDASPLADYINNHIFVNGKTAPLNIKMSIRTDARSEDNSKYEATASLSQAIFELECESGINLYKKVGGTVKAATAAYRKLGGSWADVTEEEAKDVLKNNIITQGGS